jgi:N utilization substance protein B
VGARSKARKRALDVLYEAGAALDRPDGDAARSGSRRATRPCPEYAAELVEGVVAHQERIDELLATYAEEWTLERMPPVDLAALRIGTYELLWRDDDPGRRRGRRGGRAVQSLSTDESPRFVNGLLARLLSLKPSLAV